MLFCLQDSIPISGTGYQIASIQQVMAMLLVTRNHVNNPLLYCAEVSLTSNKGQDPPQPTVWMGGESNMVEF